MSHPDFEELLNVFIPHAQNMLKKYGELYPVGGFVTKDGKVELAASDTGDEYPQASEVIDLLLALHRKKAKAGEIRTAGICLDTRITDADSGERNDAICAQFENDTGECIHVFMPYRKTLPGRYDFGELCAQPGEARVFVPANQ